MKVNGLSHWLMEINGFSDWLVEIHDDVIAVDFRRRKRVVVASSKYDRIHYFRFRIYFRFCVDEFRFVDDVGRQKTLDVEQSLPGDDGWTPHDGQGGHCLVLGLTKF